MTGLTLTDLTVRLQGHAVCESVSLTIGPGECVGLIGPNGAGKTTLMRAALGLIAHEGQSSLSALPASERARQAAWMPQAREIAWPVTVETVVRLGRMPHHDGQSRNHEAVDAALAEMELSEMRSRPATQLSGGEQARVLIARALAQDTPLLMADEPIAGLDPAHQMATMETFSRLAGRGKSVLVSLHDLGLAVRYCSRLILMQHGRLVADGVPEAVLTPERLADVFGIRAHFEQTEAGPIYQPLEVIR